MMVMLVVMVMLVMMMLVMMMTFVMMIIGAVDSWVLLKLVGDDDGGHDDNDADDADNVRRI